MEIENTLPESVLVRCSESFAGGWSDAKDGNPAQGALLQALIKALEIAYEAGRDEGRE